MDKDKFLETLKNIGTCEDEVERRTMLSDLTDEVTRVYDENSTLVATNKKFEEDNEKLRSANMQLFLKVGSDKTEKEINEEKTGVKDDEVDPRKFEDLFDDKGNLK